MGEAVLRDRVIPLQRSEIYGATLIVRLCHTCVPHLANHKKNRRKSDSYQWRARFIGERGGRESSCAAARVGPKTHACIARFSPPDPSLDDMREQVLGLRAQGQMFFSNRAPSKGTNHTKAPSRVARRVGAHMRFHSTESSLRKPCRSRGVGYT